MNIRKVRKRDGRLVKYDPDRIKMAITKAVSSIRKPSNKITSTIYNKVLAELAKLNQDSIAVEKIQDTIEDVLVSLFNESADLKYKEVYFNFTSYREAHKKFRESLQKLAGNYPIPPKISQNAMIVLIDRYLRKDPLTGSPTESYLDMYDRVASQIVSNYPIDDKDTAKYKREIVSLMSCGKFLPNSPVLMSYGIRDTAGLTKRDRRKYGNQASACYVLAIGDEIWSERGNGILNRNTDIGIITQSGGGVGLILNDIRPEGSIVGSTDGVASGPVSFMQMFNSTIGAIKQGGRRRGAMMIVLSIRHPDIFKFIKCKAKEGDLSYCNISVTIPDEFMETLERDGDWDLVDPSTNKVVKTVKAKHIWEQICIYAHSNGEPGVIFEDRLNEPHLVPSLGRIRGTNPCVTGDTFISVADGRGYVEIEKLYEEKRDVPVYCLDTNNKLAIRTMRDIRVTGLEKIYKVTLDSGDVLKVTSNHKFVLTNGKIKTTIELKKDDSLVIMEHKIDTFDKVLSKKHVENKPSYVWLRTSFKKSWELEHRKIWEFHNGKIRKNHVIHHVDSNSLNNSIHNLKELGFKEHLRQHMSGDNNPIFKMKRSGKFDEYKKSNKFYNTSGKNNPRYGIELDEDTKKKIGEACRKRYKNEEYRIKMGKAIKEGHQRKKKALVNHKVVSIEICGKDIVYNGTVDDFHNMFIGKFKENDVVVSINTLQCGEMNLPSGSACILGSINLTKFVNQGSFSWGDYISTIKKATLIMNDMLDATEFPTDEIEAVVHLSRPIGIGIMGLHRTMIELGLDYSSEEGLEFTRLICEHLTYYSMWESSELAKHDESYPIFEKDTLPLFIAEEDAYQENRLSSYPYSNRVFPRGAYTNPTLDWNALRVKIINDGLRNSRHTTIAPTGTISIIAGVGDSASLEPMFACKSTRKTFTGDTLVELSPVVEKLIQQYLLENDEDSMEILNKTGSIQSIEKIPEEVRKIYRTATEIDPEWHIKMQGAAQLFINASVSKTCNLPNLSSIEDVSNIFKIAYRLGIKGTTIYRDGSRLVQVLKAGDKDRIIECSSGSCTL